MKQPAPKKIQIAIIFLLLLCIICVLVYNAAAPASVSFGSSQAVFLGDGWTVARGGETKENVSLPISVLSGHAGQVFFSRNISAQRPENSALCIFFYTAPFTVSFNGEQIYEYGIQALDAGYKSVGSGFHIIDLPNGPGEIRIAVDFSNGIPGAILSEASVMPGAAFMARFLRNHIFTIAAVLILFAVFIYILISGAARAGKTAGSTQPLTFLAITAAVWLLARSGLLQFFTNNLLLINGIDFLSFFFLPIFALRFVQRRLLLPDRRLLICLTANTLFVIGACLLHFFRIVDFTQTLFIFHPLLFADIVCIIISVFRADPARTPHMKALRAGVVVLTCGAVLELVTYYLMSFRFLRFSFLELALLAFTLCMLYVWNSESKEIHNQLILQSEFRKMAYRDELTGVLNRAAFERDLEKLAQTAEVPFYLFMIDLNELKKVNDTKGHQAGDEFIRNTANLLKQISRPYGQLFRFGGDEFIMIYSGSAQGAKQCYEALQPYIRPNDGSLSPCFSVGYAMFDPSAAGEDIHSVLRRADRRMYACKSRLRTGGKL